MVTLALSVHNSWAHAAWLVLPSVRGLVRAGREHMRSLGYSWMHDRILEGQLEAAFDALEPELDASGRAMLASMHRAYFTGEGIAPSAPTS